MKTLNQLISILCVLSSITVHGQVSLPKSSSYLSLSASEYTKQYGEIPKVYQSGPLEFEVELKVLESCSKLDLKSINRDGKLLVVAELGENCLHDPKNSSEQIKTKNMKGRLRVKQLAFDKTNVVFAGMTLDSLNSWSNSGNTSTEAGICITCQSSHSSPFYLDNNIPELGTDLNRSEKEVEEMKLNVARRLADNDRSEIGYIKAVVDPWLAGIAKDQFGTNGEFIKRIGFSTVDNSKSSSQAMGSSKDNDVLRTQETKVDLHVDDRIRIKLAENELNETGRYRLEVGKKIFQQTDEVDIEGSFVKKFGKGFETRGSFSASSNNKGAAKFTLTKVW